MRTIFFILVIIILYLFVAIKLLKIILKCFKILIQYILEKNVNPIKKIISLVGILIFIYIISYFTSKELKKIYCRKETIAIMLNKNNQLLQIDYETRNLEFTISRNFPFFDKSRDLILRDYETTQEIMRLKINEKYGLVTAAYQLDNSRIIFNSYYYSGQNKYVYLGIWNLENNNVNFFNAGSDGHKVVSGISHDEKFVVNFFPQYSKNAYLNNLKTNEVKEI